MDKNKLNALAERGNFPWRLRVLMALADIRAGELSAESGVSITTIYGVRGGDKVPAVAVRHKLLLTIEQWQPGTLEMMIAAEKVPCR